MRLPFGQYENGTVSAAHATRASVMRSSRVAGRRGPASEKRCQRWAPTPPAAASSAIRSGASAGTMFWGAVSRMNVNTSSARNATGLASAAGAAAAAVAAGAGVAGAGRHPPGPATTPLLTTTSVMVSEADQPVAGSRETPRRVAGVDDQSGLVEDAAVVELRMVGEDHDAVGPRQLLVGLLDRLEGDAVEDDRRHVRVGVGHLGLRGAQAGQHLERGRLAGVAHAALVGHAEGEDAGPVQAAPAVVERVGYHGHRVRRHRPVDLVGQVDEARLVATGPQLPRQVDRIDADAVTADAGAGVEGHE